MQAMSWAFNLSGVEPLAKLIAIKVADGCDHHTSIAEVAIKSLRQWTGCEYDHMLAALDELKSVGVEWRDTGSGTLVVHLPLERAKVVLPARPEPTIAIYIFTSGAVSKIGISRDPTGRRFNLQGGSPSTQIESTFVAFGPDSVIREAERIAHERLDAFALGREWFAASPEDCVAVVRAVLTELGIITK
jgi:hypothetical protein